MTHLSYVKVESVEQMQALIEGHWRRGWINESERKELEAFITGDMLTVTEDVLLNLDGSPVENCRLVELNGFAYPYLPEPVWRIGNIGAKPKYVTAFPKRKSTMENKGYIESTVTHRVIVNVEIPFVGGMMTTVSRREVVEKKEA